MFSTFKILEVPIGALGVVLEDFLSPLGVLWAPFGVTLGPLGFLWANFGTLGLPLGSLWSSFGLTLDPLSSLLGHLDRLGSFLWCLGSQMQALGMICKSSHDFLDILSNNVYFLLYFSLSSFAT